MIPPVLPEGTLAAARAHRLTEAVLRAEVPAYVTERGESVTSTVNAHIAGAFGSGPFGLIGFGGGPVLGVWWADRDSIGYMPPEARSERQRALIVQQEESYDKEIAGQDLRPPLERAFAFLRGAAGTEPPPPPEIDLGAKHGGPADE